MNRKWTYISTTMMAGSRKTWMVKNRCRVGGPTTAPPWRISLINVPRIAGGGEPAILIVTSVAKYAFVAHGRRYPVSERKMMHKSMITPTIQLSSRGARDDPVQ